MSRAAELKAQIAELERELSGLDPIESMSVRQIAAKAGISPATAQRFKHGKTVDTKTAVALLKSGIIRHCPVCGASAADGETKP